jgi:hypothetical protein
MLGTPCARTQAANFTICACLAALTGWLPRPRLPGGSSFWHARWAESKAGDCATEAETPWLTPTPSVERFNVGSRNPLTPFARMQRATATCLASAWLTNCLEDRVAVGEFDPHAAPATATATEMLAAITRRRATALMRSMSAP